jgi:hypothetical protein
VPDLIYRPDFPIQHEVSYNTTVIVAASGLEQRRAEIEIPRQSVEMTLFFTSLKEMRRYRTYLFNNLNDTWRTPLWWKGNAITSEVSSSGQTWPLDMTYVDIAVGDDVWIERTTDDTGEVFTVDQVNAGDIHTDAGATASFPEGSHVYKLQDVKIRGVQSRRLRTGHETLTVSLDFATPTALGGTGASISTFTHSADGGARTLLDKIPLGESPTAYRFDNFHERVDYGRQFEQLTSVDPSAQFETRQYAINSRAELQYWELFMATVVGAREPIYTATYRDDLVVDTQASGPGWATIRVTDESDDVTDSFDYVGEYFPNSSHKQLRFESNKGEQYKEVSSAVDSATGFNTLTLATGLTADTVISQISFLEYCRCEDVFRFSHYSSYSTVQLGLKLIQRHPDE